MSHKKTNNFKPGDKVLLKGEKARHPYRVVTRVEGKAAYYVLIYWVDEMPVGSYAAFTAHADSLKKYKPRKRAEDWKF